MKYSRWYHNGLLWSIFGAAQVAALVVGEHWAATRSAQPVNVVITAADAQEDEADETAGPPLKRFGSATDLQAEAQKQLQDSQASAATLLDLAKLARDFQLMPLADRLLTRTLERNPAQVDALFLRGRTQSDLGNNGEAERLYGEVLARAPSHQKAAYNMAVLARRAGRLEEAENLFRRAIKVSSGRLKAKALHQLGVVLGERSRWSDAAESFRLAAQLRPQYFGHWLALGEALQEQGQPEEALTALEKARALRKSSADVELALARAYQERGAGAKAMRHVQRAVRLDPAGPQARAALADVYFANGQLQKAQEQYRWLLDNARDRADRAYYEGMLALLNQDPQRMLASLKEADGLRPGDFDRALARLASALHERKQYEEAGSLFDTLVAHSPHSPVVLTAAGKTAVKLEQWAKAESLLQRSLALAPRNSETLYLLARAQSEQGRAPDAIASYRKGLALDPASRVAQINLAVLLTRSNRPVEALTIYDGLLRTDSRYTPALINRARLHERGKRYTEAISDLERVLSITPDDTEVRSRLSRLLLASNQPQRARDIIADAVAEAPGDLDARLLLADTERALGRHDEALKQLRRASALDISDARPWLSLARLHADQQQSVAAADAVSKAAARDGRVVGRAFTVCRRLQEMNQSESARNCYRALSTADPRHVKTLINLAVLESRAGQNPQALEFLERALRVEPTHASARLNRAVLLSRMGRSAESIPELEMLVRQNPKAIKPRLALARCYRAQERVADAWAQYQAVLKLDPKNTAAQERLHEINHPDEELDNVS